LIIKKKIYICQFSTSLQAETTSLKLDMPINENEAMEADDDNDDVVYSSSRASKSSANLKSLDDALKYVTKINNNENNENANTVYLDESKLMNLVKKSSLNQINKELLNLVECVFQSYKSLSLSFTFENEQMLQKSMMAPFNIDLNSVRRAYSVLFADNNEQIEECIDHAVYALCISIKMLLKKQKDLSTNLVVSQFLEQNYKKNMFLSNLTFFNLNLI
jgi:hypothetical protein